MKIIIIRKSSSWIWLLFLLDCSIYYGNIATYTHLLLLFIIHPTNVWWAPAPYQTLCWALRTRRGPGGQFYWEVRGSGGEWLSIWILGDEEILMVVRIRMLLKTEHMKTLNIVFSGNCKWELVANLNFHPSLWTAKCCWSHTTAPGQRSLSLGSGWLRSTDPWGSRSLSGPFGVWWPWVSVIQETSHVWIAYEPSLVLGGLENLWIWELWI